MSVKMYLSWRTKQRKFSPLGAKHHLLLFCSPVRLHLHKREMGLFAMSLFALVIIHQGHERKEIKFVFIQRLLELRSLST